MLRVRVRLLETRFLADGSDTILASRSSPPPGGNKGRAIMFRWTLVVPILVFCTLQTHALSFESQERPVDDAAVILSAGAVREDLDAFQKGLEERWSYLRANDVDYQSAIDTIREKGSERNGKLHDGNGTHPDVRVERAPESFLRLGSDNQLEKALGLLKPADVAS